MGKSLLILMFLPSALCAREPISVYYGSWKGEAKSAGAAYNVTAKFSQTGSTIKGSYNAANKKNIKSTYNGMFTLTKKSPKCYTAKVKDTSSPVVFEAEVCVKEKDALKITSFIANGNVTINAKKTNAAFNFRSAMSKVTGSLNKAKTGESGKKKEEETAGSGEYGGGDDLPTPKMQTQGSK